MAKRQSDLSKLVDILFELTNDFWQIGAISTAIGFILTIASLLWVIDISTLDPNIPSYIADALGKFAFVIYMLPIIIGVITFQFARKTYNVYMNNRSYY